MIYNNGRNFYFIIIIFLFFLSSFFKTYLINKQRNNVSKSFIIHWGSKTASEKKILVKRFLGFKNFAADMYWIYFLQLDHLDCNLSGDLVYNFADLITYLDPHFNVVYRFAAIGLSLGLKRPDLADTLLIKAIASPFNKDDWRIYFQLGYNSNFYCKDKKKAAYYIGLASRQPKQYSSYMKGQRVSPPEYLARWQATLREP